MTAFIQNKDKLESKYSPYCTTANGFEKFALHLNLPPTPKKIAGAGALSLFSANSTQSISLSLPANRFTQSTVALPVANKENLPPSSVQSVSQQMSLSIHPTGNVKISKKPLVELSTTRSTSNEEDENEDSDLDPSTPHSTSSTENCEESPKAKTLPPDYNFSPLKMVRPPAMGDQAFAKFSASANSQGERALSRPYSHNPTNKLTRNLERTFTRIYSGKTTSEVLLKRKQYTPIIKIGEGNSSTVYEGRDTDGTQVAMKFNKTPEPLTPGRRIFKVVKCVGDHPPLRRMVRAKALEKPSIPTAKFDYARTVCEENGLSNSKLEIDVLKKVQGVRHVVKLIDTYESSPFEQCIVMELLPASIDTLMKQTNRTFSLPEIAYIATQLLECLSDLNKLDIPHGDLTPANIAIDPNSLQVKVFDFGSGRVIFSGSETPYYDFCAPEYRAPELLLEKPFNTSIDIWSLGVLLVNIYCKTKFIPKEEGVSDRTYKQKVSDDLHIITRYIGLPSVSFVQSTQLGLRMYKIQGDQCRLKKPPTEYGVPYLPQENLEGLIVRCAKERGESYQLANAFAAFVKKMITYETRAAPDALLDDDFLKAKGATKEEDRSKSPPPTPKKSLPEKTPTEASSTV